MKEKWIISLLVIFIIIGFGVLLFRQNKKEVSYSSIESNIDLEEQIDSNNRKKKAFDLKSIFKIGDDENVKDEKKNNKAEDNIENNDKQDDKQKNLDENELNKTINHKIIEAGLKEDGSLGVVLNDCRVAQTENIDLIAPNEYEENVVFVPYYIGSDIKIEEIVYDEVNNVLQPTKVVFEKHIDGDYALKIKLIRPEIIPTHRITVTYEGKTISYELAYNGKDGNVADEKF